MNSRTVEAVAACTRTLAGARDADEVLAQSRSISLGPLRAEADRAALRARFQNDAIHALHRPGDPAAAALYESLSQARLDAIGSRWLMGIAQNVLRFPGTDEDGVRWLAFEAFAGMAVPAEKVPLVAHARGALPETLRDALIALGSTIDQHDQFADGAAAWCTRAAGYTEPDAGLRVDRRFNIPDRPGGLDLRRGRYALSADKTAKPPSADSSSNATHAPRAVDDPAAALIGYRAFTTSFDRIVNASSLAGRDELERLRAALDTDFSQVRPLVSRMAKRLMRALMARQVREWRFDLDDGLLDPGRLAAFVAGGGATRPFRQELESPFPSTVVTLLIDHSGSMQGRPMKIAALTVEIFARVLERCGVKCEVLGFTTRDWDGGEPARQWADAGYPEEPGRLNALEHIVIKSADVPWRRARLALGLFLRDEMLKENIDGEALVWAHRRLLARSERRRILVVVSDGAPMDEATFAANSADYLDAHLSAVIRQIETRSPVKLAAIGIGHDVSQFYSNATRITKIDDLGPALTAKLVRLLDG